jgi:ribosomal protein S18 acetylase RimI-like enzyme
MSSKVKPEQNKTFKLRRARNEDAAAIRQVATETWHATYAVTVRSTNRERVISQSYSDNSLRRSLRRADLDSWFWVAEAEQTENKPEIIGFAEVILRAGAHPDAELTRIYILPGWQRQGVGRALVEKAVETLRQLAPNLRPPRLWLSVEAHNNRAIAFYEQRGFRFSRNFYATLPGQVLEMQEYVLEIN